MPGRGLQRRVWVAGGAAMLALVLTCAPAQAQNPITDRPSSRPLEEPGFIPQQPPGGFELPPVVAPQPEAPDALHAGPMLDVRGFAFAGNRVVSTEALQTLAAPYTGRSVSVGELEQLRQTISRYYVDRGYINSGALLPEDFYQDGIVHFRIVEGRVDQVRLQGLGRLRPAYVEDRLVRGDEPLNANVLQERFQLLLADPLFDKGERAARARRSARIGDAGRGRDARASMGPGGVREQLPGAFDGQPGGRQARRGRWRNLTGLGDTLDATLQQGRETTGASSTGPLRSRYGLNVRAYDHQNSQVLQEPFDAFDLQSCSTPDEPRRDA